MLDNTTDNSVHRLSSQDEHPSSVISKKVHDTRSNGSNSRKARKVSHGLARDNEERQVCIRHHDEIIRRTDTKQTVGNEPFCDPSCFGFKSANMHCRLLLPRQNMSSHFLFLAGLNTRETVKVTPLGLVRLLDHWNANLALVNPESEHMHRAIEIFSQFKLVHNAFGIVVLFGGF